MASSSLSPVPSITLQITPPDAQRFLEMSRAITAEQDRSSERAPLYEQLYDAAQRCSNASGFLERIKNASMPLQEIKAGMLLFHDCSMQDKLKHLLDAFSTETNHFSRQAAVSFFRAILGTLVISIQQEDNKKIVLEGDIKEPPLKKMKQEDETETTKPTTEEDMANYQSPSFDSSLATLKDEDDKDNNGSLRREIEEVAEYAADEFLAFTKNDQVTAQAVQQWYNEKGKWLVPWLELLDLEKWKQTANTSIPSNSPASLENEDDTSRVLVSFDFSGSGHPAPLCVNITEDNLFALKHIVQRTKFISSPSAELCQRLLKLGKENENGLSTLSRTDFMEQIVTLVGKDLWNEFSEEEKEAFSNSFIDIFTAFEGNKKSLASNEVDIKEFAVGFCFFSAGNKSCKLSTGFDLLDKTSSGVLTEDQLSRFIQAYLTTLVAMSFLVPLSKQKERRPLTTEKCKAIRAAVENGARWTIGHFHKHLGDDRENKPDSKYSFEEFAAWYSSGGFNIAPWLELLDLNKVLSLIVETDSPIHLPPLNHEPPATERRPIAPRDRVSSLRRHHLNRRGPAPEILFTFPLAGHRSLIVLKEDAAYVRGVVDQLGLLSMNPEDVWSALCKAVSKKGRQTRKDGTTYVDIDTFVQSMQEICPKLNRKRPAPGASLSNSSAEELLSNFFQCFDLNQTNEVALDELMGGITLLCGGKKSTKLAFAFSIFDTRPGIQGKKRKESVTHSLCGEDLFLFLRSILIITFSCCRQSLDMTDQMVGRCIADTSNMICNDVMRHQWEQKQVDRLNFDEFGQWYNDGGFERAPWLELLDLKKWVLVDDFDNIQKHVAPGPPVPLPPSLGIKATSPYDPTIPPPPPEDALDPSFFDDSNIMPMDSIDEMDMMFMPSSLEHDDVRSPRRIMNSFSFSPRVNTLSSPEEKQQPLKFHLITDEEQGGYVLSLSQKRIRRLRKILEDTGLFQVDAETACNAITKKAHDSKITLSAFQDAVKSLLPAKRRTNGEKDALLAVMSSVFDAFNRDGTGKPDVLDIACGFTVFCQGKKSDKLEFAFELLDKKHNGRLEENDVVRYIRSFLTVLLSISFTDYLDEDSSDDWITTMKGSLCERSLSVVSGAVEACAKWVSNQALDGAIENTKPDGKKKGEIVKHSISFDDFASWYTTTGHSSIPWIELLDLRKWIFTPENMF